MGGLKKTTKETLSDQYKRLQMENERYLGLIGKHKKQIASLDLKIKEEEDRIMEKRQNGSYINTVKRSRTQMKHTRILEDHVHQATLRFDKLLSEIQDLRNDIDHLRQQRATMTSMYQRLSRELEQQQLVVEGLVEKSVRAYEQRSEVLKQMQIHDRSEDSEKEDRGRWTELNELRRISDHEAKLQNFMLQKSQEKQPVQEDEARKKKAEQACVGRYSLETYHAVKQRIVELTGRNDLHQIARTFVENEEKNFANLIYFNELSNKGTRLQDRSFQLKKEIEQLELKKLQYEWKCEVRLKEMEAELELKRLKANTLEDKSTLVCKVLAEQKSAVSGLFTQLNCDPTPIRNQLGGISKVTDDNVTQFIGILDNYLQEVLMSYVQTTFKQVEEQQQLQPQNPLLVSCALLPSALPRGPHASVPPSFDDGAADAILGPDIERPLDYRTLWATHMVNTEQGKPAPHKARKKTWLKSA